MLPQGRYMHLVEANIFGVIVADAEGIIYEANDAFLAMVGYSREELVNGGVRWQQLTPPEYREAEERESRLLIEMGKGHPWEKLYLRKDGTSFPSLVSAVVIDKEKPLAMAFILDLTEQKRTEQRMDEFISIASHELRNPITTIRGLLQLAQWRLRTLLQQQTQPLPETPTTNTPTTNILNTEADANASLIGTLTTIQDLLARAEQQVMVQNRLVGDLLDSTRVQANRLELNLAPCDLVPLVRQVVEDQRHNTATRCISLQLPPGREDVTVVADIDRINQVLTNYLTNALKYSSEEQPVSASLNVDEQAHEARVSVTDHGPGLSPQEQERIWERFYRAPSVTPQRGAPSGLGLGLHICRALIQQHGGRVGVTSKQGEGSTFWFTLPLATALP